MTIILINLIPAVALSLMTQMMLHETGHMLAGFITGWHLIYLQVFRLVIMKGDHGYGLFVVSTSAYRCIMYPKGLKQNAVCYTLGGLLLNVVLTVAGLLGLIILDEPILWLYSWCVFTSGVMFILLNGIPGSKRICNDMACLILLKDPLSHEKHNAQLIVARLLFEGKTYREINKNMLKGTEEAANTNILAYQAVLEYYYHLDQDEYAAAHMALDKITVYSSICQEVVNIIHMELLYIDLLESIIYKKCIVESRELYSNGIESYIRTYEEKGDVHSIRVKAAWNAYTRYYKGDYKTAVEYLDNIILEMKDSRFIYLGEKIFCMDQLSGIRNILWRDWMTSIKTGT